MTATACPLPVRRLRPDEAPAYVDFRLAALARTPEAFGSSPEEERLKPLAFAVARIEDAAHPDDFMLGAFDGGTLVGTAGLTRGDRLKQRHKASVYGVAVAPEMAGRGVGGALMRALIAEARAIPGLLQLVLTVSEGNAAAEALYEHCGFTVFGREARALLVAGVAVTKLHMVLLLDAGPAGCAA